MDNEKKSETPKAIRLEKTIICPKCGHDRDPMDAECPRCGIVYAKWEAYVVKKQIDEKMLKEMEAIQAAKRELQTSGKFDQKRFS